MSGMTPMTTGVRMTAHTSTQWGGVRRMARNLIHQTVGDHLVSKLKFLGLSLRFFNKCWGHPGSQVLFGQRTTGANLN